MTAGDLRERNRRFAEPEGYDSAFLHALPGRSLQVQAEKVRLQYRNMPTAFIGSAVICTLMGLALATGVGSARVLGWVAAVYALSLGRFFLWRAYRRAEPRPAALPLWRKYAIAGSTVSGMLWGSGAVLLYVPHDITHQLFLVMGLLGVGAGCVYAAGAELTSFFVFLYPLMLPLAVLFLLEGDLLHIVVALLTLLHVGFTTVFALNVHRSMNEFINIRLDNLHLIQELRQRSMAAEAASLSKTRFLAAASHDLRQPLHALSFFVQALEDCALGTRERHITSNIRRCVEAMEDLFGGLLDMSRIDAGAVQPYVGSIPLADVFESVRLEYATLARQKQLSLRVVRTSVYVRSDPALLGRIIRNLVANAVRYTDRGGVVLGCRRQGDSVRIEVWDTGRGIPLERHHDIFQEFSQLQNPEHDRRKGLGLGLAIVERLGKLLDHPVQLRSVPGKGSVFTVTVPLGLAEQQAPVAAEVDSLVFDLSSSLVLAIDDEEGVQEGMAMLLRSWGCQVLTAASARQVLEMLPVIERTPDLIVSDLRLGDEESGIEVIRLLRHDFNRAIPALLVTGDTAPERIREAEVSGLPILHKPLNPTRLRTLVVNLLRGARTEVDTEVAG